MKPLRVTPMYSLCEAAVLSMEFVRQDWRLTNGRICDDQQRPIRFQSTPLRPGSMFCLVRFSNRTARRNCRAARSGVMTSILGVIDVNLVVWLPALFVLGLVSLGVCWAFANGCGRI